MEEKRFYGKGEISISGCGFIYVGDKEITKTICKKDENFFGSVEIIIKRDDVVDFDEVKEE